MKPSGHRQFADEASAPPAPLISRRTMLLSTAPLAIALVSPGCSGMYELRIRDVSVIVSDGTIATHSPRKGKRISVTVEDDIIELKVAEIWWTGSKDTGGLFRVTLEVPPLAGATNVPTFESWSMKPVLYKALAPPPTITWGRSDEQSSSDVRFPHRLLARSKLSHRSSPSLARSSSWSRGRAG